MMMMMTRLWSKNFSYFSTVYSLCAEASGKYVGWYDLSVNGRRTAVAKDGIQKSAHCFETITQLRTLSKIPGYAINACLCNVYTHALQLTGNIADHSSLYFKDCLGLHKRGGLGDGSPQWGPGVKPYYRGTGVWGRSSLHGRSWLFSHSGLHIFFVWTAHFGCTPRLNYTVLLTSNMTVCLLILHKLPHNLWMIAELTASLPRIRAEFISVCSKAGERLITWPELVWNNLGQVDRRRDTGAFCSTRSNRSCKNVAVLPCPWFNPFLVMLRPMSFFRFRNDIDDIDDISKHH